MIKLK